MFKIKFSKILIIGCGPSGYTSSLYILRSKINLISISGKFIGGQLVKTNLIENWPSISSIKGFKLMENFYNQLINLNLEIYRDEIYFINFLNKPFTLFGRNFFYVCYFIIISTGSFYKNFNIKNSDKYFDKNISNCAICDSNVYSNRIVGVFGGGDSSFENTCYLINFVKKIYFFNRSKIFKADVCLIKKFFNNLMNKMCFKLNYFLIEFIGDDFLLIYIKIKNFFNFNINVVFLNGLFIFIGNISNSKFFLGQIRINNNFILTKKENSYDFLLTSINSVYASGDVQDFFYKQAITSSATGCQAYFNLLNLYKKFF
ncbi:MAG: FAD-dependent oxidoreductase [Candidatus Nasuia deltocephalinicola]